VARYPRISDEWQKSILGTRGLVGEVSRWVQYDLMQEPIMLLSCLIRWCNIRVAVLHWNRGSQIVGKMDRGPQNLTTLAWGRG